MKNWLRSFGIVFVIFLGVGMLLAFKTYQAPTITTGEFILISGTNALIIGGIILLSLTVLTYRKDVSSKGGEMTPDEIGKETGRTFAELVMSPKNVETADHLAYLLRRLATVQGESGIYDKLRGRDLTIKLMNLMSEGHALERKRGDDSLERLRRDLHDGVLDDPSYLKKTWYHLKDTSERALAMVIYPLLSSLSPYGRHQKYNK